MGFERDLRAFCRPPMGVPVSFGGATTYPDGQPVCGLFDRSVGFKLLGEGVGGAESAQPMLRLPRNAFPTMPQGGDEVTVFHESGPVTYEVNQPSQEDDGAFWIYDLQATA